METTSGDPTWTRSRVWFDSPETVRGSLTGISPRKSASRLESAPLRSKQEPGAMGFLVPNPRKDKEIPLDRGLRVTFSIDVGEHYGSGVARRH